MKLAVVVIVVSIIKYFKKSVFTLLAFNGDDIIREDALSILLCICS